MLILVGARWFGFARKGLRLRFNLYLMRFVCPVNAMIDGMTD